MKLFFKYPRLTIKKWQELYTTYDRTGIYLTREPSVSTIRRPNSRTPGCPDIRGIGALGRYIFRFRDHCLFEIKLIRAMYIQVKIVQNRKMTHQSDERWKKEYF